jgi:hypothetical protein
MPIAGSCGVHISPEIIGQKTARRPIAIFADCLARADIG